jgi:(1->4)-alpha-D-glucan 1-alpha-D-glucosylmutase
LPTHGEKAAHVLAYSRGDELIAIVPRLVIKLGGRWDDTVVDFPEGNWHNEFTSDEISGGQLLVSDLLRRFPVALFSRSH